MSDSEIITGPEIKIPESEHILDKRQEKILLIILAIIQFTHVMDFVIMMPLGPMLRRIFDISPGEFSVIVSSYTFSAAIFGLIGAFVIDKFDRKSAMIFLYAGFTLGTFFCAIAPNYHFLVLARIFAGAFGGIMGALILAIIGDAIPYSRRGAATGMVMSAFSFASVAGVPVGLFLASHFNWNAPFMLLAVLSTIVLIGVYISFPSMKFHIKPARTESRKELIKENFANEKPLKASWNSFKVVAREPFNQIKEIFGKKSSLNAFALMVMLMLAGFTIIPFISPYMVANVGLSEKDLPLIYLFGGAATLFTSRAIGVMADKYGKKKVFNIVAVLSVIPLFLVTNLPQVSMVLALIVTTLLFIFFGGRFVPAMTMITGSVEPRLRGSFMSFNSCVQQAAGGFATVIAGGIIGETASKQLTNFHIVGYIAIVCTILCTFLAGKLQTQDN